MEKQAIKERDDEKLKKMDNYNPLAGEPATAQEYHHARHALYFLYFGTYSVISGKASWCTQEKAERVLVHLSCLREFISENTSLDNAVNVLLGCLGQGELSSHAEWGRYLLGNWSWILQLAAHYGEDKKCFPESYFLALQKMFGTQG